MAQFDPGSPHNPPRNPQDETLDYYSFNASLSAEQAGAAFERNVEPNIEPTIERDALQQLAQHLKAGGRILDAGCGAGLHLRYFLEQGFECDGFDGSAEVLKVAEENLRSWLAPPSKLKLWKADFRLLSLAREQYDGIWANRVLIHLPPPGCQRTMQTFFSALKPGGFLFVSFEAELREETFTTVAERPELTGPARHIYRYPPMEFESLVRQSGFQPLATGRDLQHPERMGILAKRV
jgi:2-polyprenyl-3-methyl-5-hydroxy-6-metoxy-1,4-benzoquinol methylase